MKRKCTCKRGVGVLDCNFSSVLVFLLYFLFACNFS